MAYKKADWSQLGDGAEVEVDGGGGAVGGGAEQGGWHIMHVLGPSIGDIGVVD
jgi:hypothetical protein